MLESRAILGDQLDLYQIHSATLESGVLDDIAVLNRGCAVSGGFPPKIAAAPLIFLGFS
jgi:hypothetical protein